MKPCEGGNSNICVAEGCYGEACEKMPDAAALDRQARALEGIERHGHDLVKIFTDIGNAMTDIAVILKEAYENKETNSTKKDGE